MPRLLLTFTDGSTEVLTVPRAYKFLEGEGFFIADLELKASDVPHVVGVTTPQIVRQEVTSCEVLPDDALPD